MVSRTPLQHPTLRTNYHRRCSSSCVQAKSPGSLGSPRRLLSASRRRDPAARRTTSSPAPRVLVRCSPASRKRFEGAGGLPLERTQASGNRLKNRSVRAVPVRRRFDLLRVHNRAHDRKTHAHAVILCGKKWVEYLPCDLLGYAAPCVGNRDLGEFPVSRRLTVTAFVSLCLSDAASTAFRIKFEKTCCNWIGSPLIRRGAPFSLLRSTTWRDLRLRRQKFDGFSDEIVQINGLPFQGSLLDEASQAPHDVWLCHYRGRMSSTISLICLCPEIAIQHDLSSFGIVQDCSQRLIDFVRDDAAISPAVEKRLTCASSTIRCRDSISAE